MSNLFVSNRDIIVTSIRGHSIEFKKGKPTHVPKIMHKEVIEKGILPATDDGKMDPTDIDKIVAGDEPKIVLAPEDSTEREEKITEVLRAIAARNNTNDFTGGGTPSAAAVSAALGWRVDQREIKPLWVAYKQEQVKS